MTSFSSSKKEWQFSSDSEYPQYQSAGLCSHVVAAVVHNEKLQSLISSYHSLNRWVICLCVKGGDENLSPLRVGVN